MINPCDNCGTDTGTYMTVYCDDCRPLFVYPGEQDIRPLSQDELRAMAREIARKAR